MGYMYGTPWVTCTVHHGIHVRYTMGYMYGTQWVTCMVHHGLHVWYTTGCMYGTPWDTCTVHHGDNCMYMYRLLVTYNYHQLCLTTAQRHLAYTPHSHVWVWIPWTIYHIHMYQHKTSMWRCNGDNSTTQRNHVTYWSLRGSSVMWNTTHRGLKHVTYH